MVTAKFHPVLNDLDPYKNSLMLCFALHVFILFCFFSGQKRESHKAVSEGGTNVADSELVK